MSDNYSSLQKQLHEVIFEADTRAGKNFDILLLIIIVLSIVVVALESVTGYRAQYGRIFHDLEWIFTIFFSIEYILRLYCVRKPIKYALSFLGIIDLLAIIPTFASVIFAGSQGLLVIRAIRLLRVFRIFKLMGFLKQGRVLLLALRQSKEKITVFFIFVILVVTILGSVMYLIEGQSGSGFTSIPRSIYWAIVTLTTVGYGDIAPVTALGQFIASFIMILGYSIIAVPTGIISAELVKEPVGAGNTQACRNCSREGHDDNAVYCKYCGDQLND